MNIVNIILSLPRQMSDAELKKNCKKIRSNLKKLKTETLKTSNLIDHVNLVTKNCHHYDINEFYDGEIREQYKKTRNIYLLVTCQLQQALRETKPPSENFE